MEDNLSPLKCIISENGDILIEKFGEYVHTACPFKTWNCNINCQLAVPMVYVGAFEEYNEGFVKKESHQYKQYIFIKCGCSSTRLEVNLI